MGVRVLRTYEQIDKRQWAQLVRESSTATWWQTEEAYRLLSSLLDYRVEVVGVAEEDELCGVAVIMRPQARTKIGQWLSRRAVIMGGVMVSDDISAEAYRRLMAAIKEQTSDTIYVEIRNLCDHSAWRGVVEQDGWRDMPLLNIRIDTTSAQAAISRIGKSKRRRIESSVQKGVRVVEHPTLAQVQEYYRVLRDLYVRRIHKPLPSWDTWERMYASDVCRFILIEYDGRIIGGSVCILWEGKVMYEWYACGRDDQRRVISPASLTKFAEIHFAVRMGIAQLDLMGAGRPDEKYGVRDFKAEFGGEMVEYGRYVYAHCPLVYRLGAMLMRKKYNKKWK